jgi:hypothetical protein
MSRANGGNLAPCELACGWASASKADAMVSREGNLVQT